MLTFLTSAKAFTGRSAAVQRQAFANWRRVCPEAEIVLCGTCEGAEAVCRELKMRRAEGVAATDARVPYFGAILQWAQRHAEHDLLVYANADILLPPDFESYLAKAPADPFLMVGQRVDLRDGAAFDTDVFYERLGQALQSRQAEVHRPSGMDFFVFRRGMFQDLKPLIVGRGGYDSALVAYCLRRRIPVIDASFAFPVVHPWHDYGHLPGGKQQAHYGADAQANFRVHGLRSYGPNCVDADLMLLRTGEIVPNRRRSWLRMLEMEWYYKRGWRGCPRFCQLWHVMTRGGRLVEQPRWHTLPGDCD
jgi:hypothetical protein